MITVVQPKAFTQAQHSRAIKTAVASSRKSAEWMAEFTPEARERAFFISQCVNAQILDHAATRLQDLSRGISLAPGQYTNPATIRLELKQILESIDYQPAPGKAGTIEDLSTDRRLNLIIETNERMAHGYGQWAQGNDPEIINEFPCQELVRIYVRKEKRNWYERWRAAGGFIYNGMPQTGGPLEDGLQGRCIARKDDPVWTELSAFGLPYPPFDFNSGVGVMDVDRDEAIAIGVIQPTDHITPDMKRFNESLEASPNIQSPDIRAALEATLDGLAEFEDDDTIKTTDLVTIQSGSTTPGETIPKPATRKTSQKRQHAPSDTDLVTIQKGSTTPGEPIPEPQKALKKLDLDPDFKEVVIQQGYEPLGIPIPKRKKKPAR